MGLRTHVYTVTRSGMTLGACCLRGPLSACRMLSTRSETWRHPRCRAQPSRPRHALSSTAGASQRQVARVHVI